MQVLDKGFVDLVDYYGYDLRVANAAKVSFGNRALMMTEKEEKLITYLAKNKHLSPFRQCAMTFRIKMPIFVMRQFVRHRVGVEINEASLRYREAASEDWYTPTEFRMQSANNKQGSDGVLAPDLQKRFLNDYREFHEAAFSLYKEYLAAGMAKEQARMVLPLSVYTEIYVTMSLEAIAHFCHLRKDPHAQWEIQQYANAIEEMTIDQFPISFAALMEFHK